MYKEVAARVTGLTEGGRNRVCIVRATLFLKRTIMACVLCTTGMSARARAADKVDGFLRKVCWMGVNANNQ